MAEPDFFFFFFFIHAETYLKVLRKAIKRLLVERECVNFDLDIYRMTDFIQFKKNKLEKLNLKCIILRCLLIIYLWIIIQMI